MTRTFAEKLAPNADLKTVLETCAREVAEETHSTVCQICLNNSINPSTTLIYEFRFAEGIAEAERHKLVLPLMNEAEFLGTVTIAGSRSQDKDETGQLSAAFVEMAARIYKAQTSDVVQRHTFHKTFLTEIDNVMTYSMGVGDALFVIVNILGKVLRVSRCVFVCTDDAETGWKSYEYWIHDQVQSCRTYGWPPTDSPLVAQTLLCKQPLVIYGAAAGSFHTPAQQELQQLGVQSYLGIPLKNEKGVHGCVMVHQCDAPRLWKNEDIGILQTAADTVSKGFLNVSAEKFAREPIMQHHHQNIDSLKDQRGGHKKVQAVRRALKGVTTQKAEVPTPVLAPATLKKETVSLVPMPESVPVEAEKRQAAAHSEPAHAQAKDKKKDKEEVASLKRTHTLETTKKNHREPVLPKPDPQTKSKEEPTKPILSKEEEEYVYSTTGLDTRTLTRIAGWISQIEANDKYANGHAIPVAKYAVATARQLGLPVNEIDTIRTAALVHDVGKMGISELILKKEDEDLNDTELLITMKHPQDGAELLESFPDLVHLAPIVHAHHEEYDGNGYPVGIKGDQIPLAARILCAANAYHAMISPRKSGHAPLSVQDAQKNLREGAGSHYDPRIVEALLRALKKG